MHLEQSLKGVGDLEIRRQVETIQISVLLRSARYLEESWWLEGTCCHSNLNEKPSAKTIEKNCARNLNWTIRTNGACATQHVLEKETHKIQWDIDIQTDHLISARPYKNQQQQKKRNWKIVDFAIPADQKVRLKESDMDKYLDLAKELERLWNMKVTFH